MCVHVCVHVCAVCIQESKGEKDQERPAPFGVSSLRKECLKKKPMGGVSSLGAGSGGWAQIRELLPPGQSQSSPPQALR